MRAWVARAGELGNDLGQAHLHIAQLLGNCARTLIAVLRVLLPLLGDPLLGARNAAADLADLSVHGGDRALQLQQPRARHDALLQQRLQAGQLPAHRRVLAAQTFQLRLGAGHLRLQLRNAVRDELGEPRRFPAAGQQLGALVGPRLEHMSVVDLAGEFCRQRQLAAAILLEPQPRLRQLQADMQLIEDVEFGARLRFVEHEQRIALRDPISLLDAQLFDDAAFEVLDALAVAVGLDHRLRHDGAIERRQQGPGAEDSEKHRDDQPAPGGRDVGGIVGPGPGADGSVRRARDRGALAMFVGHDLPRRW